MILVIENIQFLQNNPTWLGGVFVAGDVVQVEFETDTRTFSVYKNGAPITTGPQIISPNAYSSYTGRNSMSVQNTIRTRSLRLGKFCLSTTLLRFVQGVGGGDFVGSGFPYCSFIEEPGANECATEPAVQDLIWIGSPDITDSDTATSQNGSITFEAQSSYTPIYYAISPNRKTYSPTRIREFATTVPTFNFLFPGAYKVYAIDARDFIITHSFLIKDKSEEIQEPSPSDTPTSVEADNGVLYKVSWNDFNGVTAVIHILKKGFSGALTELTGGAQPMVYSQRLEGSWDKYAPIASSDLGLNIISATSFQFLDFLTADTDTYRVHYYHNNQIKWIGRIYPATYQESYSQNGGGQYEASLRAVDGLLELDEAPFLDDSGERFKGTASQIVVVARALSKLRFGMSIRSAVNLYADTMNTTAADDPLEQAYVDYASYYQNAEPLSCLEVIKRVLEPYGATILQWEGYWWIVRKEEFVGTVTFRQFDKNGVYVSNSSFNPVITKGTGIRWAGMDASIDMVLPKGLVQVDYYQGKSDLIPNNDLTFVKKYGSNTLDLTGFTFANSGDPFNEIGYTTIDNDPSNIGLFITGTGICFFRNQINNVAMFPSDKILFGLRYQTEKYLTKYEYQKIKFRVKYGNYYLRSDGTWSTAEAFVTVYESDFGNLNEFEVSAGQPVASYATSPQTLTIDYFSSFVLDADHEDTTSLKTQVTDDFPEGYKSEINDGSHMYYYELEENTDAESLPDIVRPNDYHASTNPFQWILKSRISVNGAYGRTPIEKGTLVIDSLKREFLPGGEELQEIETLNKNSRTSKQLLLKKIYHGSMNTSFATTGATTGFVGNANPKLTNRNYLRDESGDGFTTWRRDAVDESDTLQYILLKTFLAQYRKPSRRITGSLTNVKQASPAYITPLTVLVDDDVFYIPTGFSHASRTCDFRGEFVELRDITDGGTSTGGGVPTFNESFNNSFA